MADATCDGSSGARRRRPILVLNAISASGLSRLPAERYRVGKDVADPAAVLVCSADMHSMAIAASVRAIGRAGAGTNNIPAKAMSLRGVPVFNALGANANAVKELVLAGMFIAARQIAPALRFAATLDVANPDLDKVVEDGKKAFAGYALLTMASSGIGATVSFQVSQAVRSSASGRSGWRAAGGLSCASAGCVAWAPWAAEDSAAGTGRPAGSSDRAAPRLRPGRWPSSPWSCAAAR